MRENRTYGSEGGGARNSPYPYRIARWSKTPGPSDYLNAHPGWVTEFQTSTAQNFCDSSRVGMGPAAYQGSSTPWLFSKDAPGVGLLRNPHIRRRCVYRQDKDGRSNRVQSRLAPALAPRESAWQSLERISCHYPRLFSLLNLGGVDLFRCLNVVLHQRYARFPTRRRGLISPT